MTTKEVKERTGLAQRTITKYAPILGIDCIGSGNWKIYTWAEADVERLKEAVKNAKVGRPRKDKVPPK